LPVPLGPFLAGKLLRPLIINTIMYFLTRILFTSAFLTGCLLLFRGTAPFPQSQSTSVNSRENRGVAFAALPKYFEPNNGQAAPGVRFISRLGAAVYI
jgi:hypothetical protein